MKKIILFLILSFLFLNQQGAFADSIIVDSPQEVMIDNVFTVDITINTTNAIGVKFDLIFDNSILSAESITQRSFTEICSDPFIIKNNIDNSASKVEFDFGCVNGPFTTEGSLLEIKFMAISAGISKLSLSDLGISDASGKPVANIKIKNGEVTVKGNDIYEEQPGSESVENAIETPTILPTEQPTGEEENEYVNISGEQQVEKKMNESTTQSLEQKEKELDEGDKKNMIITTNVSENTSTIQDTPIKYESATENVTESNQTPAPENQKTPQPEDTSTHWLWIIIILVLILSIIYIIYNILKE